MCGNELLAQYPSPNGLEELVVFQRDCGATTGFSTQASLLSAGKALRNEPGNVFVADTDQGAAPTGPGGGPELQASWQDAHTIVLSYHPLVRISKAEVQVGSVHVHYRQLGVGQ